ncbi:MAG: tyrosine-type recombinase/integrase [Bacilli bacterium]|nr:tyrosine-type recombinase/integrase [Bacilli bacterium]MDD4809222.1 tyrosine-type recombinase/integrase [Bacilli bacterium]
MIKEASSLQSITIYEDKQNLNPKLDTNFILEDYKHNIDVEDETKKTYLYVISYFIDWLNDNNIEIVNREVMLDYKKYLKKKFTSNCTVNQYLAGVRSLFKHLETLGINNVMSTIKGLKQSKNHKRLPLTKEQSLNIQDNLMRDTLLEKRDYAIYQLCLRNGLREIELHRANVEDIDVRNNEHILYLQGKFETDKSTYIVLCATVMEGLNDYLHARGNYQPNEPLFIGLATNKPGTRLTTRSIRRTLTKMLVDNNCKNKRITPHSLRHSAITNLSKATNNNVMQAKIFARHADISSTMIYIAEEERAINAPEKLLEKYLNDRELETTAI